MGALALPWLPVRSDPRPTAPGNPGGRWLLWIVLVLGIVMLSIPHEKKQPLRVAARADSRIVDRRIMAGIFGKPAQIRNTFGGA